MTSRLHPTDIPTPQGDFVSIAPAVAGRFGHVKGQFPCIRTTLPYLSHPLKPDNLPPVCNDLSEKVLHSIRGH